MVAVIVTHTVFPIDDTKKIKDSLWLALQKLEWIYRDCLHKPLDNENRVVKWAREINQHINEARIIFEESKSEIMRKNPIEDWGFFLDHVERAYEAVLDLRDIKHRPSNDFLYTHFLSNIRKTTEEIVFAIEDFILSLEGKDVKNVYDLRDALALMNHELVQFKENQFQQIQNPDEWQNLFVFAYALRVLGNELLTIKEKAIPLSNH